MPKLQAVRLDDSTIIYIEADEDIQADLPLAEISSERSPTAKGGKITAALNQFQSMQDTIRTYTNYSLKAFRDLAEANVDKVTLEFGIKVGGEAGIPYVTKGTAESCIKITVECSFPK
jgi:hypothetical protein